MEPQVTRRSFIGLLTAASLQAVQGKVPTAVYPPSPELPFQPTPRQVLQAQQMRKLLRYAWAYGAGFKHPDDTKPQSLSSFREQFNALPEPFYDEVFRKAYEDFFEKPVGKSAVRVVRIDPLTVIAKPSPEWDPTYQVRMGWTRYLVDGARASDGLPPALEQEPTGEPQAALQIHLRLQVEEGEDRLRSASSHEEADPAEVQGGGREL